jgi:hypothetical protein
LGLDQFICEISVYTWDPGTEAARLAHKKTNPKFDASEVHHTEWIARSTDDGLTWKRERST